MKKDTRSFRAENNRSNPSNVLERGPPWSASRDPARCCVIGGGISRVEVNDGLATKLRGSIRTALPRWQRFATCCQTVATFRGQGAPQAGLIIESRGQHQRCAGARLKL